MMFEEYNVQELMKEPVVDWNRYIDPWSATDHFEREKVICVDYDETISDNPGTWLSVMRTLELGGYVVYVCTWRYPHECQELQFLVDKGYRVFYTGRKAKKKYMADQGIEVSIFIDDNPFAILHDCLPDRVTHN